jgi:hypothetical protein
VAGRWTPRAPCAVKLIDDVITHSKNLASNRQQPVHSPGHVHSRRCESNSRYNSKQLYTAAGRNAESRDNAKGEPTLIGSYFSDSSYDVYPLRFEVSVQPLATPPLGRGFGFHGVRFWTLLLGNTIKMASKAVLSCKHPPARQPCRSRRTDQLRLGGERVTMQRRVRSLRNAVSPNLKMRREVWVATL